MKKKMVYFSLLSLHRCVTRLRGSFVRLVYLGAQQTGAELSRCTAQRASATDPTVMLMLILCQVFKNLQLFLENKQPGDDLFDRLNVRKKANAREAFSLGQRLTASGCCPVSPFAPASQTSILNKHLQELMDGLTAKVFRTYNASITLQQQLKELSCCE